MSVLEYRKQVKEQLELLEAMRNTLSPDNNILKDILTELLEVGELALCKEPRVFFRFISPGDLDEWQIMDPLYNNNQPWGALIICVPGRIISLVERLTCAACFLKYETDGLCYQSKKESNTVPLELSHFSIAHWIGISEHDLNIPHNINIQCCWNPLSRQKGWCDVDAEQFLRTNLEYLRSWCEIKGPLDWRRSLPYLEYNHPLYSPCHYNNATVVMNKESMKEFLKGYLSRLIRSMEEVKETVFQSIEAPYDAIINMLLVYMDSISFPSYPTYDRLNRRDAPYDSTVILKQTVPITPSYIRQRETRGTIKPRASVAHNREKLSEKMKNNQVTLKVLRDLLAELAKDAYMRRQLRSPIQAGAKPVILSVDELKELKFYKNTASTQ